MFLSRKKSGGSPSTESHLDPINDNDGDESGTTGSGDSRNEITHISHDSEDFGELEKSSRLDHLEESSMHFQDKSDSAIDQAEDIQKKSNFEEFIDAINTLKTTKSYEIFYDGAEEALPYSDDEYVAEDDERFFTDEDRLSFSREQLVEYQHLTKLLRFVKGGGRCTTILSLSILKDHDLQDRSAFSAFKDSGAISVLLNFIEMSDRDLKLTTLCVLRDACKNPAFAYEIFRLGGIITIIDSMTTDHVGMQESCVILLNVLQFRRARRVVRRVGSISKLLTVLDELSESMNENSLTIASVTRVILLICKSEKNKYVVIRYGIPKVIMKIIASIPHSSATPIISLLAVLLKIPAFRTQMCDPDLTMNIIKFLDNQDIDLARSSAESLHYLSFDPQLLRFIRQASSKLTDIIKTTKDPSVFCSASNTLTRLVGDNDFLKRFPDDVIENMVDFLKKDNPMYLSRIMLSLVELSKISTAVQVFKQRKIFSILIKHLQTSNSDDIIWKTVLILQECGKDQEAAELINTNGGLQELWTLLRLGSPRVQIGAGWAIRNCLAAIENHGELVRSFDGVFYLLLATLNIEDVHLLAATCAIIAEVVKDSNNLQILTDLGVVYKLSRLPHLEDPVLRKPFCDAAANLLELPKNRTDFSNRHVLSAMRAYIELRDSILNQPLTKAIYDLSRIPSNCILLHDVGAAPGILKLIADEDPNTQEKSALSLRNMRKLLDANRSAAQKSRKDLAR
ncbi:unnamed protein product, partial [Didymodactylos carnosus]